MASSVAIIAPSSSGGSIQLNHSRASESAIQVSLPAEAQVKDAVVSESGSVVYLADSPTSPDVVVEPLADGAVRVQTVIGSPGAVHRFTYEFGGDVKAVDGERGIALVRTSGGVDEVVGEVAAPWAVAADGQTVETFYVVDGGNLVQVVVPSPDTVYPVVADPTVSLGWGVYVTFTKSESKTIANSWFADKAKYSSIICAAIPHAVAAAACAVISYDSAVSVHNAFKQARDKKQCTELRYIPLPPSNLQLVGWKPVSC
ncbi:hypothetical protein EDD28_0927 [Salana multivorans]|uniref:Uncharacterized protein n=2 Tax=Salana multivorans TaxID=120377 RepID=A0A3N2DA52_9MICO|nr:hypothetical protein EDD28_0927 [Salana multivorans]